MLLEYGHVRGIVEHYTSADDSNPTILGIQLSGKEILLPHYNKLKYLAATGSTVVHQRIGIRRCDEALKLPTSYVEMPAARLGRDPLWVLDASGLQLVRDFLISLNPTYKLG